MHLTLNAGFLDLDREGLGVPLHFKCWLSTGKDGELSSCAPDVNTKGTYDAARGVCEKLINPRIVFAARLL
jgi:hypothetical protein